MSEIKECNICFEDYNNDKNDKIPIFLKCGHDLCISCVREIFNHLGFVRCPSCKTEYPEDPNNLPESKDVYVTAWRLLPDDDQSLAPPTVCSFKKCQRQDHVKFCKHCHRYLCQLHYDQDKQYLITECQPELNKGRELLEKLEDTGRLDDAIREYEIRDEKIREMSEVLEKMRLENGKKLKKFEELRREQLEVRDIVQESVDRMRNVVGDDSAKSNVIYGSLKLMKNCVREWGDFELEDVRLEGRLDVEMIDDKFHDVVQLLNVQLLNKYWLLDGCRNVLSDDVGYWKIEGIEDLVRNGRDVIESPNFYTTSGYNLRVGMDTKPVNYPDHVGLFVGINKGDNDEDMKKWPFQDTVVVSFVNTDDEDTDKVVFCRENVWKEDEVTESYQKPIGVKNDARGRPNVITKDILLSPNYLQNGAVVVKIQNGKAKDPTVNFEERMLSNNEEKENVGCNSYIWRLSNVSLKRWRNYQLCSPSFVIKDGHKFIMKVCLNGNGEAYKGHVSLFMNIIRSGQDGTLHWPFTPTIRLELLDVTNGGQGGAHHDFSHQTVGDEHKHRFDKPTTERNLGYGIGKLIKTNEVFTNKKYIDDNDNMYFRFSIL